jgi:hypothetical protein
MRHQKEKEEGFVVSRDSYNKNCNNKRNIELQHQVTTMGHEMKTPMQQ